MEFDLTTIIGVVVAILIIVITLSIFKRVKKTKRGKDLILIMGPCYSGKTALISILKDEQFRKTTSSLEENIIKKTINNKEITIVDYPGHQELRAKLNEVYLPKAAGIVYMIDSVAFLSHKQEVANGLYTVLVNPTINKLEIPIIIACNKNDILTYTKFDKILAELQNELNIIKKTKAAMPELHGVDRDSEDKVSLGFDKEDFQFSHLPFELDAVNISVKKKEILPLFDFISNATR